MNTTDLFQQPSFHKGVARTLDLFADLDEHSYSEKTDAEQIKRDWDIAGETIAKTLNNYAKKSRNS